MFNRIRLWLYETKERRFLMRIPRVFRISMIIIAIVLGGFLLPSGWQSGTHGLITHVPPAFAASSPDTSLSKLSSDPYFSLSALHSTEVSPASFSFGATIVTAVEAGEFVDQGGSNIGWATSTTNGKKWKKGFLPGTT